MLLVAAEHEEEPEEALEEAQHHEDAPAAGAARARVAVPVRGRERPVAVLHDDQGPDDEPDDGEDHGDDEALHARRERGVVLVVALLEEARE